MDSTNIKLCECGCGQPAPIATRNWYKRGVKKGEPLRFICGHHRRGKEQSKEEKVKRVKKWGKVCEISPYLPGNVVIRYNDSQKRWYCCKGSKSKNGLSRSSKPHARLVYEHFFGDVPDGCHVHHKSGSAKTVEDDRPENLIAIPKYWNWRFMPFLSEGFGVPESDVTMAYIAAAESGIKSDNELFRDVCQRILNGVK